MRMRKKKNLDERLDAAADCVIIMKNDSLDYSKAQDENHIIDFASLFKNNNPVTLEIGCGKGQFGCEFAKQNPDKNILCVEKSRNVLITAAEAAKGQGLKNIKFLCGAAEYLPSYIKAGSVEEIYLNFSCPYPKNTYENHRLTNPRFLEMYKNLLVSGGKIYQKTDNMHFFEYSIEQFSKCGYTLSNISLDLHNSDFKGNIVTEYEEKFALQGCKIYRLEAQYKAM